MIFKLAFVMIGAVALSLLITRQITQFISKKDGTCLSEVTESVLEILNREIDLSPEWKESFRQSLMDRSLSITPYFSLFSGEGKERELVVRSHLDVLKWIVLRNDLRTSTVTKEVEKQEIPVSGTGSLILKIQSLPWPDTTHDWLKGINEDAKNKFPIAFQKMTRYAGERTISKLIK